MTLQRLINPYCTTWRAIQAESQAIDALSNTIDQNDIIIQQNEKIIELCQQELSKVHVSPFSMLRQRELSGRSKCLKQIQIYETDIEQCIAEIKECRSYVETSESKLKHYESLYFYSVVKLTALMAATIFGLGAALGLLITGISLTGVALVGLAAAISLISCEIFLFARNAKRIVQTNWKDQFIQRFGTIPSREVRIQLILNVLTQDMASKYWIHPIAENIIRNIRDDERLFG